MPIATACRSVSRPFPWAPYKAEKTDLRRDLLMARKGAYASARTAVASERFSALLLDVLAWIEVGPWKEKHAGGRGLRDGSIGDFPAQVLERATRRARKRDAVSTI